MNTNMVGLFGAAKYSADDKQLHLDEYVQVAEHLHHTGNPQLAHAMIEFIFACFDQNENGPP